MDRNNPQDFQKDEQGTKEKLSNALPCAKLY